MKNLPSFLVLWYYYFLGYDKIENALFIENSNRLKGKDTQEKTCQSIPTADLAKMYHQL